MACLHEQNEYLPGLPCPVPRCPNGVFENRIAISYSSPAGPVETHWCRELVWSADGIRVVGYQWKRVSPETPCATT